MNNIDYTKPLLPQVEKIFDEEGQAEVQQVIYNMTQEQQARLSAEASCFLDRITNRIEAIIWN